MPSREQLAHNIAAGFLEKAAHFAAKHGQENLCSAMEKALANLSADIRVSLDGAPATPESEAVLMACKITWMTLAAGGQQVH